MVTDLTPPTILFVQPPSNDSQTLEFARREVYHYYICTSRISARRDRIMLSDELCLK